MATAVAGTPQESRSKLMIAAAVVFAAIAALFLFVALQNSGGGEGTASGGGALVTTEVVVASQDIGANTLITAEMLELKSVPAGEALAGAFESVELAVGLPARFPVQRGEQVTASKVAVDKIVDENDLALVLEPGKRAFAVAATEVHAVGGLLLPKNFVDVIAVFTGDDGEVTQVRTVLENVQVLGVAQEALEPVPATASGTDGEDAETLSGISGQRPDGVERQPRARSVTLGVTPDEVLLLAGLQSQGLAIWLSLRPFDEEESGSVGVLGSEPFGPR